MMTSTTTRSFLFGLSLLTLFASAEAADILHFIEAKDHQRVVGDATGLKIADDGSWAQDNGIYEFVMVSFQVCDEFYGICVI